MSLWLLFAATARAQADDFTAAIAIAFPGAVTVGPNDVDAIACGPVGDSPGLVSADFNADGRRDYAVLLRLRSTGNEGVWQGRPFKEAEFAVVLFLNRGGKGFNPLVAQRYTGDIPTAVTLDLQKPGMIRDREIGRNVRLPQTGVLMSFCEKSSVVYYISGDRIRSIYVTD